MSLLRRTSRRTVANIEGEIRNVVTELRPLLGLDSCGLTLSSFEPASGTAFLEVDGACPDCGASAETFLEGIAQRIRLGVSEVREVRIMVSDDRVTEQR